MPSKTFDALLVLSFGGPEGQDDVLTFLRNVTRGRDVPDDRLAVVAEQYAQFGGRSPINDQCRALIAALEVELGGYDDRLPIYWGNRNWTPYLGDTVQQMADDGVRRALVFVTSAFGSYSGCRQYREDLDRARARVGEAAPELVKLRLFHNHPGFLVPVAERVRTALDRHLSAGPGSVDPSTHRLLFTAHSLPQSMAAGCDYEAQLRASAQEVVRLCGHHLTQGWELAYQSRSGPPQVPWLEPDVGDRIEALAATGAERVTVMPLGFISDHMEVIYDLDTLAARRATDCGVQFVRVPTVGTDPRFVTMIRELIEERTLGNRPVAIGSLPPWPNDCPPGHCPPPSRPPTPGRPQIPMRD
ncbi:MAG: ferrochelatase [Actinomycetota bacterium]|nr:ferrochelatase [Actinomycetota bacterium]